MHASAASGIIPETISRLLCGFPPPLFSPVSAHCMLSVPDKLPSEVGLYQAISGNCFCVGGYRIPIKIPSKCFVRSNSTWTIMPNDWFLAIWTSAFTHRHTHAHRHTDIHACTPTHTPHTHRNTHACSRTHTCMHAHEHTHTHTHTRTHVRTHALTHMHTHAYIHVVADGHIYNKRTHTHTHSQIHTHIF